MFNRQVLCPYCFERINLSETPFLCENEQCEEKAAKDNKISVFYRDKIPFLEKVGILPPPRKLVHADCGDSTSIRLCPKCMGKLPRGIESFSKIISIPIIGPMKAGKSTYIAVLIKKIQDMALDYDWLLNAVDDETMNNYYKSYFEPLFKRKLPIRATSRTDSFNMNFRRLAFVFRVNNKQIMIVFNDLAGEDFHNIENLKAYKNYLYNASGIICIVDPLQLQSVRKNLMANHSEREISYADSFQTSYIINTIRNLFKEDKGENKLFKIPLAFAFSKIDFIKDAGDKAAAIYERVYRESQHKKCFNENEFKNIDGIMRSWLEDIGEKDIVNQSNAFKSSGFFGFSAIGCNPETVNPDNPALDREPMSCRVEDPFLWILKHNNII